MTAAATRERPILFTDRLVLAIRDGLKTVTRRPVKPQSLFDGKDAIVKRFPNQKGCPYGEVGDLLYVREAWNDFCPLWDGSWCGHGTTEGMAKDHKVAYRATNTGITHTTKSGEHHENVLPLKWKPSIHMPKWAARLWLEIVSVRVERIQEITGDDCLLEGIEPQGIGSDMAMVQAFRKSWDSIYPGSWDRNDWAWRIEFRNSEGAADA